MLKTLSLILPIVLPSWRFFKTIEPSARVQWATLDAPQRWHAFRPRPAQVSVMSMLARLFWNPQWNETLYVVSCVERQHLASNDHSIAQIKTRLAQDIVQTGAAPVGAEFRFRLVFAQRVGAQMVEDIVYVSPPCTLVQSAR